MPIARIVCMMLNPYFLISLFPYFLFSSIFTTLQDSRRWGSPVLVWGISMHFYTLSEKSCIFSATHCQFICFSVRIAPLNYEKYNFTILQFYKNKRKVVLFYVALEEHLDFAKKMNWNVEKQEEILVIICN